MTPLLTRVRWSAAAGLGLLMAWTMLPNAHAQVAPGPSSLNSVDGWINTADRIKLSDLRGKIVLLDFWTYCCINCHHILPDLEYLEDKYPNQLVVLGIHSPKFPAERDIENVRRKVAEYRIKHPVAQDSNQRVWKTLGIDTWPTLILLDARGREVLRLKGEGHRGTLDEAIARLIAVHRARGELNETPLVFTPESEKPANRETPLLYPGKVVAAGDSLFIADTGHNRIVIAGLDGSLKAVVGDGKIGMRDGAYERASFNRPQGIRLDALRNRLYVADTENHAIRAIDLTTRSVTTVAGTGEMVYPGLPGGPARRFGLNSPWDLVQIPETNQFLVAMAGTHQIYKIDFDQNATVVFSGSGIEEITDGPAPRAAYAQPSGLTTDGRNVFVADSETSSIRLLDPQTGAVRTLLGKGLFDFGDVEGGLTRARLQHCLAVEYANGKLYVADTYNNKIKVIDFSARTKTIRTLVGDRRRGDTDDPPRFDQPGGLSVLGGQLYVADTNNHKIRVVDLATLAVKTLTIDGLTPPPLERFKPSFPLAQKITLPETLVKPGDAYKLEVALTLPNGFQFGPDTPIQYLIETPGQSDALGTALDPNGGELRPPLDRFTLDLPLRTPLAAGETLTVTLSVATFLCRKSQGFCQPRSVIWTIPLRGDPGGTQTISLSNHGAAPSPALDPNDQAPSEPEPKPTTTTKDKETGAALRRLR